MGELDDPILQDHIYEGDALSVLRTLPDESVHCCVTSPPYWGLRDYLVEGQLGLEDTPEEYVEKMVEVFREAKRVLRSDGVMFLNMGDCYARSGCDRPRPDHSGDKILQTRGIQAYSAASAAPSRKPPAGLKEKDLVGMPWRLAFALQADGWYLRSDIIWHKTNSMPESVTDRPTKAHEYLFLLSKSPRYYYDAEAIKEPAQDWGARNRVNSSWTENEVNKSPQSFHLGKHSCAYSESGRNKRTVWTIPTQSFPGAHFAVFAPALIEPCILAGCPRDGIVLDPFMGAGTTAIVALKHGRHYLGIELNPIYAEMARNRIQHGTVDEEEIRAAVLQFALFE